MIYGLLLQAKPLNLDVLQLFIVLMAFFPIVLFGMLRRPNLVMSYLAASGHEKSPGDRLSFEAWVLETIERVWTGFAQKFVEMWRTESAGDAYPAVLFAGADGLAHLEAERQAHMALLFRDTVGFAAAKIIRRILGLAHNIDFELIADPRRRAVCEARSLRLARAMMVDPASFPSIAAVTRAMREVLDWQPDFAG